MLKPVFLRLKNTSLPTRLLVVICAAVLFGNFLSMFQIQLVYTFSIIFKEVLSFALPFVIISFVLSGILSMKKNAPLVLLILIVAIIISNFCTSTTSFFVGKTLLPYLHDGVQAKGLNVLTPLKPLWWFTLTPLIASEKALLLSLSLGLFGSFFTMPALEQTVSHMKVIVEKILNGFFIPLLPLYVLGFLLKLIYEGALRSLFSSYGKTCLFFIILQIIYQLFLYLVASGFSPSRALMHIKNALPSYLTAFGTMSSSSTIPVTVNCMEKNTGNRSFSEMATPILANVHLAGDCVAVPMLALTTLFIFTGTVPSFGKFMIFIFYFCITMLAATGVPGGGILVMIPILKSILGFTPEMAGVVTTIYLVTDGFSTANNVMGDNALAMLVNKILKKLKIF